MPDLQPAYEGRHHEVSEVGKTYVSCVWGRENDKVSELSVASAVHANEGREVNVDAVVQEDQILPENKVVWRLFDARYGISKVTKVCEPVVSCEDVRKRHPESPWPTPQHS